MFTFGFISMYGLLNLLSLTFFQSLDTSIYHSILRKDLFCESLKKFHFNHFHCLISGIFIGVSVSIGFKVDAAHVEIGL